MHQNNRISSGRSTRHDSRVGEKRHVSTGPSRSFKTNNTNTFTKTTTKIVRAVRPYSPYGNKTDNNNRDNFRDSNITVNRNANRGGFSSRESRERDSFSPRENFSSRGGFSSNTNQRRFVSRFAPRSAPRFGGKVMRKTPARGESIEHARFIYKPTAKDKEKNSEQILDVKHIFADFKFAAQLQKNLEEKGYINPTPIQDQTIMHALKGQDVLGLANTGSGKTAAFLLPLIDKISKNPKEKVIILAPTRELALQIDKEFKEFAKNMRIFSAVCVGGMPIYRQIQQLRLINNFIIGTPGRIKDLANRNCIRFSEFTNVVLDEVDHMLDMGFVDDITEILKGLNENRQSLFFSATMPERIKKLVEKFQNNPHIVDITVKGASTKSVEQDIIKSPKGQKFTTLCELLKKEEATRTIIFVETKKGVEELADNLRHSNFRVGYLHGDRRQRERAKTLDDFKTGMLDVLVATDVAARGIDVKDISHVINYTVPQTHDDYVHRIGRAGRAGKTGKAFTFV